MSVCLDFVWTIPPETFYLLLTKLGIMVYYHEKESTAEKLICYLQGEGHSEFLCNQNMTVSTIILYLLNC